MAFRFIDIQHLSGFCRQGRIYLSQTFRYILMYSRYYLERFLQTQVTEQTQENFYVSFFVHLNLLDHAF